VDRLVLVAIILLCLPVLTIWAMAIAARLRGPQPPAEESHKRVGRLATEALPYDEHRDEPAHAREQAHHANRPHL
jgi:hypothetical protein